MCFPQKAAVHAALGVEEWLGRPKTLPWRLLVPHGYLHALVCVALGLFLFRTFLLRIPDRRVYHLSAIALLLWTGFGAAGTLFFAVLFFCVEAYASAGCPSPVPSWIWLAWQTQIKLEAMRHLQVLEHSFREASEGMSVDADLSWRLLSALPALLRAKTDGRPVHVILVFHFVKYVLLKTSLLW